MEAIRLGPTVSGPQTSTPSRAGSAPFAAVVGLGAFLLFTLELVLGKRLLPWFGGTSALWTSCLLFFQSALVLGYAWAHLLAGRLSPRRQRDLHLLLLVAALALVGWRAATWPSPICPPDAARPLAAGAATWSVLRLLASAGGLPFVALAATSPLLAAWFALTHGGASPYRLYALSNAGSLLALVAYPLVIEPFASLRVQGWLWAVAFAAFAAGVAACAIAAGKAVAPAGPAGVAAEPSPSRGQRATWVGLAAVPSLMLVAVTSHLTQEVAAVPLLWTLPLALYLLSLIACFAWPTLGDRGAWLPLLALAAALAVFGLQRALALGARERVVLWCAVLLVYGLAGHAELARRRPGASRLTAFYLAVAVGGALGAVLPALVAPLLFSGYWELQIGILAGPLALAASWLADPRSPLRDDEPAGEGLRPALAFLLGLCVLAGWLAWDVAGQRRGVERASRGFYGVLRVVREEAGEPDEQLKLLHGQIAHGLQLQSAVGRRQPTTYFGPTSGAGLALTRHPRRRAGLALRVGVVGLGVGTLAAWSKAGDAFRFYELDPSVAQLSLGEAPAFRYLRDAAGEVSVALGDGRLALEREAPHGFDVLVLDAFSSDAIPTHLLTREAFVSYARQLRDQGVIAVHVTNRFLDLKPVVRGAARALGWRALHVPSSERGVLWSSDWMLVSRNDWPGQDERIGAASLPPLAGEVDVSWTDDWSDLLRVLKR
jgi:hypothetical protein